MQFNEVQSSPQNLHCRRTRFVGVPLRVGIPLRGHWDSMLDLECDEVATSGNSWPLLLFRVAAGDLVLHDQCLRIVRYRC